MKKPLRVCIVIPAYNESSVIGDVIENIIKTFKKTPYLSEIVVINDASKDKTNDVARKHGATVIDHILNSGAGNASTIDLGYSMSKFIHHQARILRKSSKYNFFGTFLLSIYRNG